MKRTLYAGRSSAPGSRPDGGLPEEGSDHHHRDVDDPGGAERVGHTRGVHVDDDLDQHGRGDAHARALERGAEGVPSRAGGRESPPGFFFTEASAGCGPAPSPRPRGVPARGVCRGRLGKHHGYAGGKKAVPLAPPQETRGTEEKERGAFVPAIRVCKLSARAENGRAALGQDAARSRRVPGSAVLRPSSTPIRCSKASRPPSQPETPSRPRPSRARKRADGPAPVRDGRAVSPQEEAREVTEDHRHVEERVGRGHAKRRAAHLDPDIVDGARDGREDREHDADADAGVGEVVPEAVFRDGDVHHVADEGEEERADGDGHQHRMDRMRSDGRFASHQDLPGIASATAVPAHARVVLDGTVLAHGQRQGSLEHSNRSRQQNPASLGPAPSGARVPCCRNS